MFVPFNELPESSKIWVFQSDREFTAQELKLLEHELKHFTNEWTAHNNQLKSSFTIKYNHFIILSIDETVSKSSGCAVDSSVRFIKSIGEKLSIDFYKRDNIAFLIENKITIIKLEFIKNYIKKGNINIHSVFFNNFASSIGLLSKNWMVPLEKTWLKKYI